MIPLCNPCGCIVAKLKASFEEALSPQRPSWQKTNAHYVMKIFLGKTSQSYIGRLVNYASYQSDDPLNCDPLHLPATKISCDSTPSSICFATFCKAGRCFSAACSMVMALAIYTRFRQPMTRCSLRMGTAIEAIFSS